MKRNTMILSLVTLTMPMAMACGADPYGLTQEQMMQIETTILHQQIETIIMHDVAAEGSGDSLQDAQEDALDDPADEELKTIRNKYAAALAGLKRRFRRNLLIN